MHQPGIVNSQSQSLMTDFSAPASHGHHFKFYGMGTFSLDWTVSTAQQNVTAYGHVGDTYGVSHSRHTPLEFIDVFRLPESDDIFSWDGFSTHSGHKHRE